MRLARYLTVALVVGALGVAACGDDSGSGSGSKSTASSGDVSAGVKRARAVVAEFETVRPDFLKLPKLDKKPPSGLNVTILTCPLPACQETTSGAVVRPCIACSG